MRHRVSKYGAVRTTAAGVMYHSKKEALYADELRLRLMARDIREWRRQVCIPLEVHGRLVCKYYMDFVIEHNNGDIEFVEVKGHETDAWKLKWKLFEALMHYDAQAVLRHIDETWTKRQHTLTVVK